MTSELWTIAAQVLTDFALTDAGPLAHKAWQTTLAEWLTSLSLGALAALMRVPPWVCWSGLAALFVRELALDLYHGGLSWVMVADTNLDLVLPVLGYIFVRDLFERVKQ